MSHDIYHDLYIKASPREVFEAISTPEHLNNWWTLKAMGKPENGYKYNLYFAPEYNWYGEVVRCNPVSSFYIKMIDADQDWNPTTFGFELEEVNDRIKVKFSHKGWTHCNDEFRNSSFCWALLLNGLKNYLEKGIIVPFEDRA